MSINGTALIVEYEPELAELLGTVIGFMGFDVELIADGKLAHLRLLEIVPTLVLLDMHLPHISGLELLTQIRKDSRLAKTRVIVTSADIEMAAKCETEADFVLTKPIGLETLESTVSKCIRQPHDESD